MGVNSLITWAVIDLIIRAVIIETRASIEVMLEKRELQILRQSSRETRALYSASWYCNNAEMRVSTLASLVLAVMSRRGFQPSRLGATLMAMISPASGVWILLFDDLSSVIFRQPTMQPSRNLKKLRGLQGRLDYIRRFHIKSFRMLPTLH